jgi:hypothetical protein
LLDGDVNDDILIGSTTGYDANNYANVASLDAILSEWASNRMVSQRIYNPYQPSGEMPAGL